MNEHKRNTHAEVRVKYNCTDCDKQFGQAQFGKQIKSVPGFKRHVRDMHASEDYNKFDKFQKLISQPKNESELESDTDAVDLAADEQVTDEKPGEEPIEEPIEKPSEEPSEEPKSRPEPQIELILDRDSPHPNALGETDVQLVYELSENDEVVKLDEAWQQTWTSMVKFNDNEASNEVDSTTDDNEVDSPAYSPIKVNSSQEPLLRQTNIRSRYHNKSRSKDMADENEVDSPIKVDSSQEPVLRPVLRQTNIRFRYQNTSGIKDMADNEVNSLSNVSSTQTGQEVALRRTPENSKSMTMTNSRTNWKIPKIDKVKKPIVEKESNNTLGSTSGSMKNQIPFG